MSKKITFQELIDSIAEESENTKQFTHDFMKDFVSVVNDGLEDNRSVNIAGFGKFKLRKMDEREGVNPQTGEPITIPAHNKAVFKPYKNLRELVNAPYQHLEAELIDEENESSKAQGQAEDESDEEQQQFIPSAPPPSVESQQEDNPSPIDTSNESAADEADSTAPWDQEDSEQPETDSEFQADPFGLDEGERQKPSFEIDEASLHAEDSPQEQEGDDDDIVEFTPEDTSTAEKAGTPEDLDEESPDEPFTLHEEIEEEEDESEDYEMYPIAEMGASDESDDVFEEEDEPLDEEFDTSEAQESQEQDEEAQKPHKPPVFKDRSIKKNTGSSQGSAWVIAAVMILLLLAVGAWYFMGSDSQKSDAVTQTSSPAPVVEQQQRNNAKAADPADSQVKTTAKSSSSVRTSATAKKTSSASAVTTAKSTTHTVEKGETLWSLADFNYNDAYKWPWIYDENQPRIKNPNIIKIGQVLDIPKPQGPNGSFTNDDSLQVAIAFVETYSWYKERGMDEAKFYLYSAKKYHADVLKYTSIKIDDDDLAFANQQ